MNDTLSIKELSTSTLDAANFPGTARSFPRVVSQTSEYLRQSTHVGDLSPCLLRIAHQPRSAKSNVQRSLIGIRQTLARLDAQSNPISYDQLDVNFQFVKPQGITEAEYLTAAKLLVGALLESDGALLKQMFNGEY